MYNFRGIQSFLFYFYSNLIFPNISQVFNIWGTQITASLSVQHYTSLLKNNALVSMEDAIFRNEKTFIPGNLNRHRDFWEKVILKDHPHKQTLLGWLPGVTLEEFMNSYTVGEYQGLHLHSVYPTPAFFGNYVPEKYTLFVTNTIQEWLLMGVIQRWEATPEQKTPTVVCPLLIEQNKPRLIWDGRYLNEFTRDIPFTMDNAAKVANIAWKGAYMFKLDHKNGYFHVPIAHSSRKFFGFYWESVYYVLCVLPFGWKSSPYIYHTLTEAVNMYIRSLGVPMLGWIDDMLGLTQQLFQMASDEEQFYPCQRSVVVVTYIMFMAGYFLGKNKCFLIPEKLMTYLGIDCDTFSGRFSVPEKRVLKYLPILQSLLSKSWISYASMESIVGKLASLDVLYQQECGIPDNCMLL